MAAVEADILGNKPVAASPLATTGTDVGQELAKIGAATEQANKGPIAEFLERPAVRRFIPYVALAILLALAGVILASMSQSPPRALYPNMADTDKEQASQVLKKAGIKASIDPTSGNLLVDSKDYYEARITLASAGLPKEANTGFQGLKDTMPLGTSQFMEQARYNASVEEELAQSIKRINTIQDARVHLALPKQSVFIRDREEPKASVIVTPFNGRAVSDGQVQAIVHLVSSSIPYLTPASVSVVDQFGRLLTESRDGSAMDASTKQQELRRRMEAEYAERIVSMLAPIFGAGNVRAQVAADVDFSVVEQTVENFDPNATGTKVRSEQSRTAKTTDQKAEGIPGSLSNQPPAGTVAVQGAAVPPNGTDTSPRAPVRDESSETKNYEMDRTVRYVVDPAPHVRRLSVAVTVNNAPMPAGATTPPASKPLTEEETTRLTNLVKGAVGYSADRGDVVTLLSEAFEAPKSDKSPPFWQLPQFLEILRYAGAIIAIVLLALFVVRPVVARLTYVAPEPTPEQLAAAMAGLPSGTTAGGAEAPEEESLELKEGETLEELKARMKPKKKSGISAEMLDTANSYDDKVTVVRMLVSQDARRVALVLKNLITKDLR
jgi:flagellar M-ring protein FliF